MAKQLVSRRPLLWILLHAIYQKVAQFKGTLCHLKLISYYSIELLFLLNVERVISSVQLISHGTEGPNIDFFIVFFPH